jgi:hypothetical protein
MILTSIENAFKKAAHDIVVAAKAIEAVAVKISTSPKLVASEAAANAVLDEVDPAAATVAETAEALLAKACAAVQAIGGAAAAGGVNITLDSTAVADVKAVIAATKNSNTAAPAPAASAPAAPAA